MSIHAILLSEQNFSKIGTTRGSPLGLSDLTLRHTTISSKLPPLISSLKLTNSSFVQFICCYPSAEKWPVDYNADNPRICWIKSQSGISVQLISDVSPQCMRNNGRVRTHKQVAVRFPLCLSTLKIGTNVPIPRSHLCYTPCNQTSLTAASDDPKYVKSDESEDSNLTNSSPLRPKEVPLGKGRTLTFITCHATDRHLTTYCMLT